MTPTLRTVAVATLLTPLAVLAPMAAAPPVAWACGGFFCNAQTQTPIVQAGERVLFARTEHGVTMHIEVVYQGDPTSFGWIVPLAERPLDADGQPVPIDKALSLSATEVFSTLQAATNPTFSVRIGDSLGDECSGSSGGFGCGAVADAKTGAADGLSERNDEGDPIVLDEAAVGPYEAQLLEAPDVDTLFDWLNRNDYYQDPAARPLLQHYVDRHYVFLGLRLQNGKTNGDLRPIRLDLSETAPCVPLRITQIAASDDMPILVWVMGPGRAVPKNFLSAVVNDMALIYPGGSNYLQVVSDAVDDAAGHAWITEMAGPTATLKGQFMASGADLVGFDAAEDLEELYYVAPLLGSTTMRAILKSELVPGRVSALSFAYQPEDALLDAETTLVNDLATLKARLRDELYTPLSQVEALLDSTTTLTRFFTTSDASEMTKDPIFAFNPELPDVPAAHVIVAQTGSTEDCTFTGVVNYPDNRQIKIGGEQASRPFIGPIADEKALLWVEVLDEEGPAKRFDPSQAAEIDRAIDGASMQGVPSLPADVELQPPPPPSHQKKRAGADDDGCAGSLPGAWILIPVAVLALLSVRSRRRSSRASDLASDVTRP